MDTDILFAYRQRLETLPQQSCGSIPWRRSGMKSNRTVHSYLRSTKVFKVHGRIGESVKSRNSVG
jgi:hypothetical protein